MKARITTKALKESGKPVITVNYCGIQSALALFDPAYYHAGSYGWNYDAYIFDRAIIATGYRTPAESGSRVIHADYRECELLESAARKLSDLERSGAIDFKTRKERAALLIDAFISHIL